MNRGINRTNSRRCGWEGAGAVEEVAGTMAVYAGPDPAHPMAVWCHRYHRGRSPARKLRG
jgi:hypothetical protein